MQIRKIITNTTLAVLIGAGIFGCGSKPVEQKTGIIEKEWINSHGYYNATLDLVSDTGKAWVIHHNNYITPILDSLFDAGDTVTIKREGHTPDGIDYYQIVK